MRQNSHDEAESFKFVFWTLVSYHLLEHWIVKTKLESKKFSKAIYKKPTLVSFKKSFATRVMKILDPSKTRVCRILNSLSTSLKHLEESWNFLTFSESMNIAPEVVHTLLPVHQLPETAHQPIALVFAVVSLIGEFNFISSLNTFRDDVGCETLCVKREKNFRSIRARRMRQMKHENGTRRGITLRATCKSSSLIHERFIKD